MITLSPEAWQQPPLVWGLGRLSATAVGLILANCLADEATASRKAILNSLSELIAAEFDRTPIHRH